MSASVIANTLGPRGFSTHLSQNYENEYWEFEKRLGFGAFGFTALLKGKGSSAHLIQRMAEVNGASHLVSILASCSDIVKAAASRQSGDPDMQIPGSEVFEGLAGIVGPAVALEYLEYGDMMGIITSTNAQRSIGLSLYKKVTEEERDSPIPDAPPAVIRASVGLAYPPGLPIGSDPILEELPSDPSLETVPAIGHCDFNTRNIMLSLGDGPEHEIGVMAKLIDFGLVERQRWGSAMNIFDAAVWLDPELRDFLARCMYEDEDKRPTLREALPVVQNAVDSKTAMSFPEPDMETESAVTAFVQEFIFNVPP
ncbi:kinase-like protein [Nemania diffusa]|nr:kinase-like protein [Nemania diffusa]